MDTLIFQSVEVEVVERSERYFIRFDAGAHIPALREDEIPRCEVDVLLEHGEKEIEPLLLRLQRRLLAEGVDPWVSNWIPSAPFAG
jgi:hypothetical protein